MQNYLRHLAKKLRKRSTDTENLLWNLLKAKQFQGLKWRRQEPIENYVVDFVCYEKRIIIECDGSQHLDQFHEDQKRDQYLTSQGFKVLRFWNSEIFENTEGVLESIWETCCKLTPPSNSLPQGEGGL